MPRRYSTSRSGSESTEEEENHSPDRSRSRNRSSSESSHDEGVGSSQVVQHLSKSPSRVGPPSGGRPTGGDRHPSLASHFKVGGRQDVVMNSPGRPSYPQMRGMGMVTGAPVGQAHSQMGSRLKKTMRSYLFHKEMGKGKMAPVGQAHSHMGSRLKKSMSS